MSEKLRQSWQELQAARPGRRFVERYRKHQASVRTPWHKPFIIGLGVLIVAVGLVALPAPGPGTLVLFVGAALIAQESLITARLLDRLELRIRALAAWGGAVWRRSPLPLKALYVLVALALTAAGCYVAYLVLLA